MISTLYEPFRHWSDGGSIYILSDLHFADSDCKLMDPHWITPEEQLEIINRLVFMNDTFICLGDVGEPKYVSMIKARKKIMLLGNHDARGAYKNLFNENLSLRRAEQKQHRRTALGIKTGDSSSNVGVESSAFHVNVYFFRVHFPFVWDCC